MPWIDGPLAASPARPSVGALAAPLFQSLLAEAASLGLGVRRSANGAVLVDAGITAPGGLEAGRRIAELCMGGLGWVRFAASGFASAPFGVTVHSARPVLACLASQYAGWSLSHEADGKSYFALAAGPGRARAAKEALFEELDYRDETLSACFVLETAEPPPEALIERVADDCGLAPSEVGFVLTPTTSLAGTVQIVARVLEVALHKAHQLGFPVEQVRDGLGRAPLPPPSPDFLTAMGRTNDAILFGGEVQLFVTGPAVAAADLAARLPASTSAQYGKPFARIFAEAGHDFYKIDGMLFSPARVVVTALESGESFTAGKLDPELIARSFGHDSTA